MEQQNCDWIAAEAAIKIDPKKLLCQSGRHAWLDDTSRERCCSGIWKRSTRVIGEHEDLDLLGRIITADGFVLGWVRI